MRAPPLWRGVLVGAVAFFVLIAGAAVAIDALTSTIAVRNRWFVLASLVAAVIAGFAGARVARREPRRSRYLAGILGPSAIALVFGLTSTAADQNARWIALLVSIAGAAAGVYVRERRR